MSEKATFGAGCFWGTDKFFRKEFNLKSCYTGYLGGTTEQPTYQQGGRLFCSALALASVVEVCTGKTGHAEVIQVEYDPAEVKYRDLVKFFFRMHDPTTLNRQGNDVGTQYRSAIFYHNEDQKNIAEEVKEEVQKKHFQGQAVVTEISPATTFWKAEDYHQEYLINNPGGYCNHKLRW